MKYNGVKEWDTLPTFRPRVQFPSPAPIIEPLTFLGYSSDTERKKAQWLYFVSTEKNGAESIFIGRVRNENGGKKVTGITYDAHEQAV